MLTQPLLEATSKSSTRRIENRTRPRYSLHIGELLGVGPLVGVGTVFSAVAVNGGLPLSSLLSAIAAILVTQVLPGAVIWRAVRPVKGWLIEDLAAGFAIGFAVVIPAQIAAGLTGAHWLSVGMPLSVLLVLLFPRVRSRVQAAEWARVPWWFGPMLALPALSALPAFRTYVSQNKLTWPGVGTPHIDSYLHLSLSAQLFERGPTNWPALQGERFGYHWFGHAWIAQVARASGTELAEVLMRVLPAIIPVVVVASVAAAGLRIANSAAVGATAATLTMVGATPTALGLVWPSNPINPLSPTLGLGVPTFLLLIVLLLLHWRGAIGKSGVFLMTCLAFVSAGTKGSTLPLVIVGIGVASIAALVQRQPNWRTMAGDLGLCAVSLVAALAVVFRGSAAGLSPGFAEAARQTVMWKDLETLPTKQLLAIALVTLFVGVGTRAALTVVLVMDPAGRRDPTGWMILGISIAAMFAAISFSHPGHSQMYFVFSAVPAMSLGSALGLARWYAKASSRLLAPTVISWVLGGFILLLLPATLIGAVGPQHRERALPLSMIGVLVVIVVGLVGYHAQGRHRLRNAALLIAGTCVVASVGAGLRRYSFGTESRPAGSLDSRNTVGQGQIDAAIFIREHSSSDDVVMTNRHCTKPANQDLPDGCEARRWVVAAYSQRQVLIEGWSVTPTSSEVERYKNRSMDLPFWDSALLNLNDDFIAAPSKRAHKQLWDMGVRWVYVEETRPAAATLEPFAVLRHSNDEASAWKLVDPAVIVGEASDGKRVAIDDVG